MQEHTKKWLKSIVVSILILLVLLLIDNRSYLFSYLPHRESYEQVGAYIEGSKLRHHYTWIRLHEGNGGQSIFRVKKAFWEHYGDTIIVGYAKDRSPEVCRIQFIVTWGELVVLVVFLIGHTIYFFKHLKSP